MTMLKPSREKRSAAARPMPCHVHHKRYDNILMDALVIATAHTVSHVNYLNYLSI